MRQASLVGRTLYNDVLIARRTGELHGAVFQQVHVQGVVGEMGSLEKDWVLLQDRVSLTECRI